MADTDKSADDNVLPWGSIKKRISQWESQDDVKKAVLKSSNTRTPLQPVHTVKQTTKQPQTTMTTTTTKQTAVQKQTKVQMTKQQPAQIKDVRDVKKIPRENGWQKKPDNKIEVTQPTTVVREATKHTIKQQPQQQLETRKPSEKSTELPSIIYAQMKPNIVDIREQEPSRVEVLTKEVRRVQTEVDSVSIQTEDRKQTKQRPAIEEQPLHAPELVASIMGSQKLRDDQKEDIEKDFGDIQSEDEKVKTEQNGDVYDGDGDDSNSNFVEYRYNFPEVVTDGNASAEGWQLVGDAVEVEEGFDDVSSIESGRASRRATISSDVSKSDVENFDESEHLIPELTVTLSSDQEIEDIVNDGEAEEGDVVNNGDAADKEVVVNNGEAEEEDVVNDVEIVEEDGNNDEDVEEVVNDGEVEETEAEENDASDIDEEEGSESTQNMTATEEYDREETSDAAAVPTPTPSEYRKSVSLTDVKDDTYVAKLAALIYLRGINTKQEFCLATSVDGAGLFSDVVLKYKSDDIWKTCFIQVRHKDTVFLTPDVLTDATGRFSLDEAYASFEKIRSKTLLTNSDEIFHGSFEDTDFVIHTNAIAAEKLTLRLRPGGGDEVNKLLKSGLNDEAVIKLNEESDMDIFLAHPEKRDFLRKLKIIVGQPSEIDLDHLIKMELRSACSKYLSNVHIIYRFFIEAVQQWWTDDKTFLTQKVNILDKAESILNVYNLTARQKQLLKLPDVSFRPDYTAIWKEEFRKGCPLLCIQTTAMTARFSCTKLMQCLWEDEVEYIFTSLPALLGQSGEVVDEWMSGQKDLLVIVSEESDDLDQLCENICRVFKKKQHKRLVVLSPPFDTFTTNLQLKYGESFDELFDPYDLVQLDKESTDQILEREVRFQGCPIYLRCIIGDDLERTKGVLSSNNFDTILFNSTINVGTEVSAEPEPFVARTIQRRDIVDSRILTSDDFWGIIAVSNITVDGLKKLIPSGKKIGRVDDVNSKDYRYLALDSLFPEQEYYQLCDSRKDVHWFHNKDGVLHWRRSQRNLTSISRYIEKTLSTHTPENVLDLDDRVVVVVADPKAGGTPLTSHLAFHTKQADPSLWVIQVHLNQAISQIENAASEEFNIVDFLAHVCLDKEATELERDLLRFGVEERGNVAVFLDGLDAVVPRYLRASLALLSALLRTRVSKVFITAQPSLKEMLESHLATFAYEMCPLDGNVKIANETDA